MAKRLNNVMVPSANLDASTDFFQQVLGLELRNSGATFSWFKSGNTNIMLFTSGIQHAPGADAGIYLEFTVDDLEELLTELAEKEITVDKEWEDENGNRFVSVTEPGGNCIHFYLSN